jgi:signal peptidase
MNNRTVVKKARWLITVIGIILCLTLVPVLIVNITIIVKSYVNPDKVPSFMGYKPFIVLSDSMNPGISAGDLVLTKEADTDTLKVGDIISYRVGDSVITHRITGITEKDGTLSFTTKGDANDADDAKPIDATMIEGTMLLNIPKFGNVALFMQTPAGMLICIGVPVLLLVAYDILRRRRYDQEKHKKTIELEKELELMRGQIKLN